MNLPIFEEKNLPFNDFLIIGLVRQGNIIIGSDDKAALLAGRRTQLLLLNNLDFAGMRIASLYVKLSLADVGNHQLNIIFHPQNLESTRPNYLTSAEQAYLESGRTKSIEKWLPDEKGEDKWMLIEFDYETKEFIRTPKRRIVPPDAINGFSITQEQKIAYMKGQIVQVADGTNVQYTATNEKGIRANHLEAVLSRNTESGIVYTAFSDIRTLTNYHHDYQEYPPTNAYLNTLVKLQRQESLEAAVSATAINEQSMDRPNVKRSR